MSQLVNSNTLNAYFTKFPFKKEKNMEEKK